MKKILFFGMVLVVLGGGVWAATNSSLQIEKDISAIVQSAIVDKYPEFKNDEIKVRFNHASNIFDALADESKQFTFKVMPLNPRYNYLGSAVIPVQVYENGVPYKKVYLKSHVEVFRQLVVSSRQLPKSTILSDTDLRLQRVDIVSTAKDYFTQKEGLIGSETKTIIRSGTPFLSWMVRPIPLVYKNDLVKLQIVKENLRVSSFAKALSDGYLNRKIKVRREGTKQEFFARVVGTGEVEVE